MEKKMLSVRLPAELVERLHDASLASGRSVTKTVGKILTAALEPEATEGEPGLGVKAEDIAKLIDASADLSTKMEQILERLDQGLTPTLSNVEAALADLMKTPKASPAKPEVKPTPSKPEPKERRSQSERRAPNRPKAGTWAAINSSKRSHAHLVAEDSAGGVLTFACGKDASGPELHADDERKRCPKCLESSQPAAAAPVDRRTPKKAEKQARVERRSGKADRRQKSRPTEAAGRRKTDWLKRCVGAWGEGETARICGVSSAQIRGALKDDTKMNQAQWSRLMDNDKATSLCGSLPGTS